MICTMFLDFLCFIFIWGFPAFYINLVLGIKLYDMSARSYSNLLLHGEPLVPRIATSIALRSAKRKEVRRCDMTCE